MTEEQNTVEDQNNEVSKNLLEWVVFAFGLLMILSILGYLSYRTYMHEPSPADIQIEYKLNPAINAPYRFHLTVTNIGGETAESVIVEMELVNSDTTLEKSEIEFPFVPQSSQREGWLNFTKDPTQADSIIARVVSFNKP